MQTISTLKEGDWVDGTFLVAAKQIMIAKNGGMYLSVKLADKTGEVDGKLWDNAEEVASRFEKEDFIRVKGVAANYQGMMQVKMKTVEKMDDSKVDLANFLETSPRNIDEMVNDLSAVAAGVKNKHLNQLMNSFLADKTFMDVVQTHPGGKGASS